MTTTREVEFDYQTYMKENTPETPHGPEARQKRREAVKAHISLNDSLDKVLEKIREIAKKAAAGNYIYRGEPKCYDKVSSSLYRQYEDIKTDGFDIESVQRKLLEEAKQYTDQTDDFEIMSELQHYGGDTNLIDFTTDYLIALFFACDRLPDEDGRIILLKQLDDMRKHIWRPRTPDNRVNAQKSIFLQPKEGFIDPDADAIIFIPKDLKEPILTHLRKYHGISTKTIYNDLHGFITNQRSHQSAYTEFFYGVTHQEQGNNEKAIKHYDKAIELNPQFAEAYNNRGVAYRDKGDFDRAIQDFNEAIELNPSFSYAYNNRGLVRLVLGEWEKAIADLTAAKNMGVDIAAAFRQQHGSVEEFERRHNISLPADIATLLTEGSA